jgi:hypothetical protein
MEKSMFSPPQNGQGFNLAIFRTSHVCAAVGAVVHCFRNIEMTSTLRTRKYIKTINAVPIERVASLNPCFQPLALPFLFEVFALVHMTACCGILGAYRLVYTVIAHG